MQLSLFDLPRAGEVFTPCLVGICFGFDAQSKWHDPADPLLARTQLVLRPGELPELAPPYVPIRRTIHVGRAKAAGPGWVQPDGQFAIARTLQELVATAAAAAELSDLEPLFADVPERFRQVADHWRRFTEPDWQALNDWPCDANPEVI